MSLTKTITDTLTENRVTSEQIAKVALSNGGAKVASQTTDEEYRVTYNATYNVLSCNCKAGQEGKGCWHKRATLAKLAIMRLQVRDSREQEATRPVEEVASEARIEELVRQGVERKTAIRVTLAQPKKGSGKGKRLNYDPSFSLLK
jgi:hypothetical protein